MTDTDRAIAEIRAALDAGPTPGPWQKATDWSRAAVIQSTEPFKRVVCTGNQNNDDRFGAEDWSGATWVDADFIARCNPENMRAILAHVEAQAAEIERLSEFADLWYFVMDEAPRDFERIVAEYQPKAWLQEAAKLRAARK